jgi:selenocysteine lyase/cysteine desulfurase
MELLLEVGIPAVTERVRELTDRLCAKALQAGLEVYSSRRPGEWSGIVSLNPPGSVNPGEVVRRGRQEGFVFNHRAGRLRVSPHAYNSPDEIDRLVQLLGGLT